MIETELVVETFGQSKFTYSDRLYPWQPSTFGPTIYNNVDNLNHDNLTGRYPTAYTTPPATDDLNNTLSRIQRSLRESADIPKQLSTVNSQITQLQKDALAKERTLKAQKRLIQSQTTQRDGKRRFTLIPTPGTSKNIQSDSPFTVEMEPIDEAGEHTIMDKILTGIDEADDTELEDNFEIPDEIQKNPNQTAAQVERDILAAKNTEDIMHHIQTDVRTDL